MLHRNHEVWIAYDGVALPELARSITDAPDRSANIATAYIMSEKDKGFTVHWRHIVPKTLLSVSIRMDGVLVQQHLSMPGTKHGQLSGVACGANTIRPFFFSNVPRLRSPDLSDAGERRDFGTIRVSIVPIHYSITIPAVTFAEGPLSGKISASPRSEMHCISLQKEHLTASVLGGTDFPTLPIMPPFDMQLMNEEAAMFEFRYGPLVCLQNLGVLPPRSSVGEGIVESVGEGIVERVGEGAVDATPSTPTSSMLGKRSRSQYEDISSLSAEAASGKGPDKVIKTYITRSLVREKALEDSVVSE